MVFIVPHVDIELEDNKQFISNIPRTRMFGKINQRAITWKIRKGEQSFLWATHTPTKLHEISLMVTELLRVQECLEKKN